MIRWILAIALFFLSASIAQTKEPMGAVVGELQERWTFPSDHLPIGATVDGLKIASWNVLNTLFIEWIERNGQGLARSRITADQILVNEEGLMKREQDTVGLILEMIQKGRQMIALQECGETFLHELERRLPPHMAIVLRTGPYAMDQEAILYDTNVLRVEKSQTLAGIYSTQPKRKLMNVLFERLDRHTMLRVVNVHIPGEVEGPAHFELARFVAAQEGPCIAVGDFNFDECEMQEAFDLYSGKGRLLSPYCTNITPVVFRSICIDHFYVSGLSGEIDAPEELISDLPGMVQLLFHYTASLPAELHSIY